MIKLPVSNAMWMMLATMVSAGLGYAVAHEMLPTTYMGVAVTVLGVLKAATGGKS